MELNHIRCFCLVYEERSFAKAAERSFFTRQGIGKLIKGIEAEWNVTLFTRQRDGVIPTKAADEAYPLAKKLLADYDRIVDAMETSHCDTNKLSLAMAHGVVNSLSGGVFLEFGRAAQGVDLDITITDAPECVAMVADGRRELALTVGPVDDPSLEATLLKQEDLYLIGLASLLDRNGEIPPGTTLYLVGNGFGLDRPLLDALDNGQMPFVIDDSSNDYDAIVELVKMGRGVCTGPDSYLGIFAGSDVFTRKIEGGLRWTVSLVTRRGSALSPAAKTLAEHLTGVCQ